MSVKKLFRTPRLTGFWIAVGLTASFAAGCGSPTASRATTTTGSVGPPSPAGATPAVLLDRVSSTETVLVDRSGRLLYHLSDETAGGVGAISCTGPCTATWHPLLLPAGDLAPVGAATVAARLGVVVRPGGARQVTYDGEPLYTFAGSGDPRSRAGWQVVVVTGVGSS